MTGFLLRIAVFALIFYLLRMVINALFKKGPTSVKSGEAHSRVKSHAKEIQGQTAKDPNCGTYVATSIALTAREGGETLYFCSDECRRTYLETAKGQGSG